MKFKVGDQIKYYGKRAVAINKLYTPYDDVGEVIEVDYDRNAYRIAWQIDDEETLHQDFVELTCEFYVRYENDIRRIDDEKENRT